MRKLLLVALLVSCAAPPNPTYEPSIDEPSPSLESIYAQEGQAMPVAKGSRIEVYTFVYGSYRCFFTEATTMEMQPSSLWCWRGNP